MSLYIGNSKVTGVQRVNDIPVWGDIEGNLSDQEDLQEALNEKQDTLVSGTNIKTINNESILGEGNIEVDLSNKANKDLSNVSWNNVNASDIPTDVELLSGSGTLTLEDNKLYKLTSSGSTTFSLPTITDTTKFHQIMVQLKMSSVVTINVGTSYYFNSKAPDLSKAGSYDLVWEYDNIDGYWVFGATSKGTA